MNKIKERQLRELKRLECKLKSKYNQNQYFKRLYESNNKENKNDKKGENCIIISNGDGRNIFSEVPEGIIDFLNKMGHFDNEMFDPENNIISMGNYFDILQTVKYLIDIIQLDLTKAFVESDRFKLLDDLKG